MSYLALKQKDEINLFSSVIYHVSLCVFFTLIIIRNAAIAINILVYVVGNTLSTFTKQFIMIATERSASIAKSCLVLVEFLAVNYIKYIDFDDGQEQKVSSEQSSIKTILANASKRVQSPVKKGINSPVVSAEMLKKSEAARKVELIPSNPTNKLTEASPVNYSGLSLRKAEKERLPLEQRYRSSVPSSLGNHQNDQKSTDDSSSKRYSTPASEKPKRTLTMKLINSTAANRVMRRRKQRQGDDDYETKPQKNSRTKKPEDINLNLFDERPSISQPPRARSNKSPGMHLQIARRYLKVVAARVKKHRNTI